MNRHEAHTLICAAQSGNTPARNELIEYYCSTLVPALAASWGRLTYDDAVGIGNLAAVESVDAAIKTYDVSRPCGIAAYVRQAIVRSLSRASRQALTIQGPYKCGLRDDDIPKARLPLTVIPETADPLDPEQLAIESETRTQLLRACFGLLSARDTEIMVCLYFEDMTAAQVAERFEISESLVDYVRSNALKLLRTDSTIQGL